MSFKLLALSVGVFLTISACQETNKDAPQNSSNLSGHKVLVQEVIQASSYTYLRVTENEHDFWIAISRQEVDKGKTLYYSEGVEMRDFESKTLERTFETIFFVAEVSEQPLASAKVVGAESPKGNTQSAKLENISVAQETGGISVAELYSKKDAFASKNVKVRGQVTKFNSGIMGRNWVHLQDGTSAAGNHDLTVTTNDEVQVGDVATFEGKIVLNQDFGAGYYYDVIMEKAKLVRK